MFQITHFANSFITVTCNKTTFTCDPWIGKTSDNGWFSFPLKNKIDVDSKIFSSEYVYISHLHCDHLDFKTLRHFKNKKLKFVIKKFSNGTLKRRLEKFTNKEIIEVDPFKKTKLNKDLTISIVPQIISNTSNLPDHIEYDLDTSIIIQSNKDKTIFYNNVDMPMNINVLKKINEYVTKDFKKKIDIFCYALGAASEFPQCFLNLNREKEKNRIIKNSLNEIVTYLKYLKPKFFFPAGGTYTVYGKFYKLNKFVAQPTFEQIKKKTSSLQTKVYNLIGGGYIRYSDDKNYSILESRLKIDNNLDKKFINNIKNINYYYSKNKKKIDLQNLDYIFEKAKEKYFNILAKNKKIDTNWRIDFKIFKNLEINKYCGIDKKKSSFLKNYNLKKINLKNKKIFNLQCYIEYQLFEQLLLGKLPWNTSLSGSVIMFKRKPNIYNVDMDFALNFLRL